MIPKICTAVTLSGSGTALVCGLTTTQWQAIGVVGGLAIALAGLVVNAVFQYLRWKRENRP